MSLRFLLGILPSGLPEENNISIPQENISRYAGAEDMNVIIFSQTPAKFHIGMLTISLLVGIAYGGFTAYKCWMEKKILLGYIRNLVIALTCRTFFSIVFDGAILLDSPGNVGGGNFLLTVEQICSNLVIAFWLTLNIYLHERVQRNFNNEPTLLIYQFGVPGVAVFFAFVWIFTLQDQWPNLVWWINIHPFTQWIVNSINLLFLLIQLALLANIIREMMKITLDNDAVSLLRKISAMMGVLVLIFWLHFGLSIGRVPLKATESYLYFSYLIDGLECILICSVLFFFNKWVQLLLNKLLISRNEGSATESNEILISGGRGIVTIDSVFMTRESGRWKNSEEDESKDVVYSNIVEPERLKKTFELYKRLNIIPTNQVTTVEGEEFYDCQLQTPPFPERPGDSNFAKKRSSASNTSKCKVLNEDKDLINLKITEPKRKKNAFYASKYLILDTKESEIPKYLETRPSVSSFSGKDSLKDERFNNEYLTDLNTPMSDEVVQKWLNDNSKIMQKNDNSKAVYSTVSENRNSEAPTENTFFSAINSVVSGVLFGTNTDEKKSLDKEIEKNFDEFSKGNKQKQMGMPKTYPAKTPTIKSTIFNREKIIIKPEVNSFKKLDFGVKELKEKNEPERPKKPIDVQKTEFNTDHDLKPKVIKTKLLDTRINEVVSNEYPMISNFKAPKELLVVPDNEKQRKQEPPTLKNDENLKVKLHPKESSEANIDTKNQHAAEDQSPTANSHSQKPSPKFDENNNIGFPIEKDRKITEENKTLGESADEFKNKPELPILNISGLETLKNNLSLTQTKSDSQIKPTSKDEEELIPENPQKCITYSDLLEFRSQQDKSATDQSTGISKKLFDFSEALSSTIGSLISAGSSFFNTGKHISDIEKHDESVNSDFENKKALDAKTAPNDIFENHQKTVLSNTKNEPEVTGTSSDSEFSIERNGSTSSAGSFSVDQYYLQLMKGNENFYIQSNSVYQKREKEKTLKV